MLYDLKQKKRVSVIAGYLSYSEASTKTNVSVTFSSAELKPARKRYGECEGRREGEKERERQRA